MNIDWSGIATIATAVLSAVAATGSWMAARRANATSQEAHRTADAVAGIEKERWQADLTPDFELDIVTTGSNAPLLVLHLAAPDALEKLDEISLFIESDFRRVGVDESLQPDVDRHVFGPMRFRPRVDKADSSGRAVSLRDIPVGRGTILALERTRPGHWMGNRSQESWQAEFAGQPVRLRLTCRRGDYRWTLRRRVPCPTE